MRIICVLFLLLLQRGHAFYTLSSGAFRPTSLLQATDVDAATSTSRREALQIGAAIALSTVLIDNPSVANAEGKGSSTKTILLTGGNSGIGFEACKRLAGSGHTVILPCRSMQKSLDAINNLDSSIASNVIPAECDLASLKSINTFAQEVSSLTGGKKLDVVCLNAGLARDAGAKEIKRTADGFELTVGTNHFGHFYLNHLLLPLVQPNGHIVVTASGVHDPESPGGAQGEKAGLGDLLGLERDGKNFEMVDGAAFNADKAYKDSKLCNVLFTRELQKRLISNVATKGITVNCFNPGLIVSTGLFRDQNPFFTKLFDIAATDLLKVGETPAWGGGSLAYMTTVETKGQYYTSAPGSSKYGDSAFGSQFALSSVSKEAQDEVKGKRLWELTEDILGIKSYD